MNEHDPSQRPVGEPSPVDLITEQLDEPGLEALFLRTEEDPEASDELDFVADLAAAAETKRELLEASLERQENLAQRADLLHPLLVLCAVAAGLLVFLRPVQDPAASRPQAPIYRPATLRGAIEAKIQRFESAMTPYVTGQHAAAVQSLAAFLEEFPGHGPARFYRAASLEQLERTDEALALYTAVAEDEPGFLGEHARWRLAQLHLRRDDEPRARRLLEALREQGGAFAPNAAELYEELSRR